MELGYSPGSKSKQWTRRPIERLRCSSKVKDRTVLTMMMISWLIWLLFECASCTVVGPSSEIPVEGTPFWVILVITGLVLLVGGATAILLVKVIRRRNSPKEAPVLPR